jgi:MFS transporter, Spinster family, sphingosine-1-phosphate transporter
MSTAQESYAFRWRATIFLAAGTAINFGDRAAFSGVLAPLREELKLSDAALGVVSSLFLWSHALGSPIAGTLADRFSRSRLVVWSLFLWSCFIFVTGTSVGLGQLGFLRVGLGLSECLFLPAAFALMGDYHGAATRGKAMSLLSLGAQCGVVAGGAGAAFLAQRYGWRMGFYVLGACGIGLAAISGWFLRDAPTPPSLSPQGVSPGEAYRYLLKVPSYYFILAKQILAEAGTMIFLGWLPLYLLETFHLKLGEAGFAGTFMLQASLVLGIALGGWFSDRVAARDPTWRMVIFGFSCVLGAPFTMVFLMTPGFAVVAAAVAFASFFRGMGTASERPAMCDVIPPRYRSTALGLMNTCASASGALGVMVAGLLKGRFGLNAVFAGSAALNLLAGLLILYGVCRYNQRDIARAREDAG